ncbi:protein transport protein sec39 [Naviculisporaceae sp. PSN 640]
MALLLSPPKLVLLAVHLAVKADIDGLAALAAHHGAILRKELLLRIILTYLPEALQSSEYVSFIQQLERGAFPEKETKNIDSSVVGGLTEDEARKRVKKLRLLPLTAPGDIAEAAKDVTTQFLLCRAYRVDEEAGLLTELPALLTPFLDHAPCIRTLMVSTLLPLLRRNCEYHTERPISYTLLGFQQLPDEVAVNLLLSQTGSREEDLPFVGRDLRGLIGPWLLNEKRWKGRGLSPAAGQDSAKTGLCPGWGHVLTWLTAQAASSWKVAVNAIAQWEGPSDIDLGGLGENWLGDEEQIYLKQTYARAALASAYLISDASTEALEGAYELVAKTATLLDQDPLSPLHTAVGMLPPLAQQITDEVTFARNATYMRNDLLDSSNILTSPSPSPVVFLQAVILSAFILTRSGCPISVRRAGDLALFQDEREQKSEASKLIHGIVNNNHKTDDRFWIKVRNEVLWLRDWGMEDESVSPDTPGRGVFGQVKREFLEVEILKAFLANNRFTLARSIYEDSPSAPLSKKILQDTIYNTAMTAYDNASNPNRTRGGLKKCDDIIKAFPKTAEKSLPATQRIEALLRATHALSEYRLVLKQSEPFTPVVLRVHPDPVSIVGKILEQNPKSYTRIQDLLDLGTQMVKAGLTTPSPKRGGAKLPSDEEDKQQQAQELSLVERRITALTIDAALAEDDFETAYSYVVNRVSALSPLETDEYSWKAALQTGKYRRTAKTLRPTHLGTSSANVEIRHLEQRIDCLSTALRIAPPPTLQEILNAFRRAEEELDAAIKAEQEEEDAWDAAGDTIQGHHHGHGSTMPGGFEHHHTKSHAHVHKHASGGTGAQQSRGRQQQTEEAPMSLFDLSRASVLSAQKNFSALSSLSLHRSVSSVSSQHSGSGTGTGRASLDQSTISVGSDGEEHGHGQPKRARKRDQLREAALGSLVSGVGWLVGAPAPAQHQSRDGDSD